MRFTTHTGDEIEAEIRETGVDRIEIIEGLYGGLLEIQATRKNGEWSILATWDDGLTEDFCLLKPIPGLH